MARIAVRTRAIALGVAIALAAVAASFIFFWLRGLEADAVEASESVQAFVAKDAIPAGTPAGAAVGQGLIGREAVPRRNLAEGAIASLDQIDGKVAAVDIVRGEQILASRFAAQVQNSDALPNIPEDRQAMSIDVGIPPGVAGFVQVGDHISVLAQLADASAEGGESQRVQFLLQDVEVLALGQRVVTTNEQGQQVPSVQQTQDRVLATLAVTPQDAEKLAYAIWNGQTYFTLLPDGQEPASTPGRTSANVFD